MHEGGKKAIVAALAANAGIALAKFVGFAFTGASSLLAEGIHSTADTGNQLLLLLGGSRAKKAPDAQHPFGYGRERFFWAFVVAIVLFSLGSVFALYEGYNKLRHPHELEDVAVAYVILVFAMILEGLSFRTAYRESIALRGQQTWREFIRHTKIPELAVVLLEDSGALVGLVFALVGITLAEITGDARFDALGSIAIGLLLGVIAYILARENKSLLIGEAASPQRVAEISSAIADSSEVLQVIHMRTLHLGPEELLVAAKVEFAPSLDQPGVSRAIDAAEKRIRAIVPEANLIFIEPDQFVEPALEQS